MAFRPALPFAVPFAIEGAVLRGLLNAPVPLQRVLAGAVVQRDGLTLSPEIKLMLRLQKLAGHPDAASLPLDKGRREIDRQSGLVGGRQPIAAVRDLQVDGAQGPLAARLYTPREWLGSAAAPTLMFIHGGGMIYGGLASHDAVCRFLAHHAGVQVLAIDYRLAPESPYPAAVEDCAAAYRWLVANADRVHADVDRLAVGGDSAGGYLSATTAIVAAEENLPLAFQLLVYPVTDFVERSRSRDLFADGFFLTSEFMDLAERRYFPPGTDVSDPRASVLRRTEFPEGLAPAFVATAGFDPLRDEGEAYAQLLAEHGISVETKRYDSMIHGFFNMVGCGHEATANNLEIAARVAAALC